MDPLLPNSEKSAKISDDELNETKAQKPDADTSRETMNKSNLQQDTKEPIPQMLRIHILHSIITIRDEEDQTQTVQNMNPPNLLCIQISHTYHTPRLFGALPATHWSRWKTYDVNSNIKLRDLFLSHWGRFEPHAGMFLQQIAKPGLVDNGDTSCVPTNKKRYFWSGPRNLTTALDTDWVVVEDEVWLVCEFNDEI